MADSSDRWNISRRDILGYTASSLTAFSTGCLSEGSTEHHIDDNGRSSISLTIPNLLWDFDTDGRVIGSPSAANSMLYVGSADGKLYAFEEEGGKKVDIGESDNYPMFKYDLQNTNAPPNAGPEEDVTLKWSHPTYGVVVTAPAVVGDDIYFGSEDGFFYSLSADTGEENWRIDTGGMIAGSSPAVVDGTVYFGSGHSGESIREEYNQTGLIHAVNAQDGKKIWTAKTDRGIQSTPAVHRDFLYHGCQDNYFYARDLETGEQMWSFGADDIFCSSGPALKDGVVYVGSEDHSMYALDADDGSLVWEFETDDIIVSSPVATEDAIYFGSHDKNLYAVDPDTGEELWRFETNSNIFSSPAYRDGIVYVGSNDGNMYAVHGETGEEIWSYDTGAGIKSSPVVTEDMVYFGAENGKVYAIENKEVERETYREYRGGNVSAEELRQNVRQEVAEDLDEEEREALNLSTED